MAKLLKTENPRLGDADYLFDCPGCKCSHGVWVHREGWDGPAWGFNGNMDSPTFEPSIAVKHGPEGKLFCHFFVRDGKIQYLADSTHELAGQTVELPEI